MYILHISIIRTHIHKLSLHSISRLNKIELNVNYYNKHLKLRTNVTLC